ncbi:CwfJ domain-containing protein [Histoplasma capsulatum G186AR]|uniref:CwfJ domain-containing protein n=2 Tax=Ajellomyces capsulatus TaxID=5037 RepID=C0NSD7_AJECG|nr:CwfJ domain-containing protein [Histoplasma capsulatum G186AR]EEH05803.1 CwfJ domain-containing protein [Histoplasma capsulatum G186AR]KAG5300028.1 CwfJ domain-containing protein [Histoplasma capsulatum]QSS67343.1 CwfJ domain-containing protein [Histoplasma capsulatum G186AR]
MASKIIVLGSVKCSIKEVFAKLAKLQAKQNFAFAIISGDLFGDVSDEEELSDIVALLDGTITVPLPTYFTVGNHPIPARIIEKIESDDEVCTNLYFLGRRSTLKTSEGIRIVTLGGNLERSSKTFASDVSDKYLPRYTQSDARSLFGAHNADILITNQWPKSIRDGSKVSLPEGANAPEGSQCVADLCTTLKPRYHFSSEAPFFYEREPFFHLPTEESPDVKHITRFINLAPFSKSSNQKWLSAFTLDPHVTPSTSIPAGATASPLLTSRKRDPHPDQAQAFSRFAQGDDYHRPSKRARRPPPPGPSECFFCLSNPNIATHLITSIGSECYLTTAKGPLPTSTTFRSLGFPGHMLIIPLTHAPTFDAITESDSQTATTKEMQRYRTALHAMLDEKSNGELGAVTWEVSRAKGIHIHWQFLPVPSDLISRGLVEAAFRVEAENLNYPKFRKEDSKALEKGDYFRVMIWESSKNTSKGEKEERTTNKVGLDTNLILPLSPDFRFDLQFGRRVMAKLLQLEKRMNWRDDVQSQDEEAADAEAFKKAFEKFDFSAEE